jgi:hypothetical protein
MLSNIYPFIQGFYACYDRVLIRIAGSNEGSPAEVNEAEDLHVSLGTRLDSVGRWVAE